MALFKIAKYEDEAQEYKDCLYKSNKELRNLLFYCRNHCVSSVMTHLYPFGIECVYDQFLYLQKRRYKETYTKAWHFIISFDSQNYEKDLDCNTIESIMAITTELCLPEYQCISFLHADKPSHRHIHYVVNPVNINDLHILRWSFWELANKFAEILGSMYGIPLVPVTYQNEHGQIIKGYAAGDLVYQQKFLRNYGLREDIV